MRTSWHDLLGVLVVVGVAALRECLTRVVLLERLQV